MSKENETGTFYAANRQEWRQWLKLHHDKEQAVWLIYQKKMSGKPSVTWSEAVDEALCFGWVDSKKKTIDEASFMQFFCRRKPKSTWSKINKEKIVRLSAEGLITKAGLACIEAAKQNGSWKLLDEVEELAIPTDLHTAFWRQPDAEAYFFTLSKSVRKSMLQWLVLAKRQETRQKRIEELVEAAMQKLKPRSFR
jgi:uncharacterized protein YdeI (YjbR/CyaY-like superfamily)